MHDRIWLDLALKSSVLAFVILMKEKYVKETQEPYAIRI
jgi:hypothetical protein